MFGGPLYPAESSTQNRLSSSTETNLTSKKHRFSLSKFYILAAFVALSLAGCNGTNPGDPGTVDNAQECPNGGVFKDGGCKNPDSCDDSKRCVPGYTCQNSQCKPDVVCSGNSGCSAGICQDGVCVNPPVCVNSESCIKGFLCDLRDDSATKNKCVRPTCPQDCTRGICDLATNTCVSRTRCTAATVDTDCVLGDVCAEGFCKSKEAVCQKLDCDSKAGVCDPEKSTTECVDKDQCTKNEECAARNFCTGNAVTPGECKPNYCSGQGSPCQDGGVCVPDAATGGWKCENPTDCTKGETCQNGYSCVGTTCLEQGKECGPTPCSGVRQCVYDSSTRTAACRENAQGTCHSFSDCNDDRICRAGQCTDAPDPKCTDDDLEPNNSDAEATNFYTIPEYKRNSTNLCKGDQDWYAYKVDKEGNLVVQVTIHPEDVGTKEVKVQLLRKTGSATTEVKSGTNVEGEEVKGAIEISTEITDSSSFGDYYVVVSDKGGKELAIRYKLNIALAPKELFSACENATSVTLNPDGTSGVISDRIEGTLDDSSASDKLPKGVEYRCLNKKDPSSGTKVYAFTLGERSYVTVNAQSWGARNTDVVLAMRSVCTDSASESACVNDVSPDEFKIEKLNKILEKGTHYLFVTSPKASDANGFALTIQATPATCDPNSSKVNKCDPSGNNLIVCNEKNTGEELKYCVNGCENGACKTAPGDVCNSAIEVTKESPYSGKFFVENYNNSYDEGTACSKITDAAMTSGKDIVFKVKDVPVGHAVQVQVKGKGQKAVYFTRKACSNSANCTNAKEELTHAGTETTLRTSYKNDSNAPEDVFVFLDYNETTTVGVGRIPTTLDVEIKISDEQTTCSAGATKCNGKGDTILTCDDYGTSWAGPSIYCGTLRCNDAQTACKVYPGDDCNEAAVLVKDQPVTADIASFKDTNAKVETCKDKGTIYIGSSNDAMYKLEAKKDRKYTIELASNGVFKPFLWIAEASACSATGALRPETCLWGINDAGAGTEKETFTFLAREDKDYIVVVESSAQQTSGQFILTLKDEEPAGKPNSIDGCVDSGPDKGKKIKYYDKEGTERYWNCSCTGNSKECAPGDRNAHYCMDAKVLYANGKGDSFTEQIDASYGNELGNIKDKEVDQCHFPGGSIDALKGSDYFFKISLEPHETVEVTLEDPEGLNVLFFQKESECGNPASCFGSIQGFGSQKASYKAGDEPEVIYAVVKYSKYTGWTTKKFTISARKIDNADCAPNSVKCRDAGNSNDLIVCDEEGAISKTIECKNGCMNDTCKDDVASGDSCTEAIDIGKGGYFIAHMGEDGGKTNTINPTCAEAKGREIVYKVSAEEGDVIYLDVHPLAGFQAVAYILNNCSNPNASCVATNKSGTSFAENAVVNYLVPESGDYYVVIDAPLEYAPGPAYTRIEVLPKECDDATSAQSCIKDNKELQYCFKNRYTSLTCKPITKAGVPAGGCDDSEVKCKDPSGDYCRDAIALEQEVGTEHEKKDTLKATKESHAVIPIENDASGSCAFSEAPVNGEKYYSIELKEGQKLKAEITQGTSGVSQTLYLINNCTSSVHCLASTPFSNSGTQGFEFKVPKGEGGTYYLVVAKASSSYSSPKEYTLKYTITDPSTSGTCVPYQGYCSDEHTLVQCLGDEREVEVSCDCRSGKCQYDTVLADSCDTAPEVESGFSTIITKSLTNNINATSIACLGKNNAVGYDTFYKIQVPKYRTLRAVLKVKLGDEIGLFFLKGCSMSQCVAGKAIERWVDGEDVLTYTAGADDEEIIVGVTKTSSWSSTLFGVDDTAPRLLWLSIDDPQCDPTQETLPLCDSTKSQIKYCNPVTSNYSQVACKSNTCELTLGRGYCTNGDGTSCYEAKEVSLDSQGVGTVSGDLSTAKTSNVTLPAGNNCTQEESGGNDLVYRVTVPAGKKLKATVTSTASPKEDLAIYALTECGDTNSCVAGADKEKADNPETFTTSTPFTKDTVVHVYVDSRKVAPATKTFELKLEAID